MGSLLKAGADINVSAFETAGTPLATAARYGHLDMVKCLLDRGADPDIADGPWATPLARAVKAGYNEITGLLKQHGGTHTVAL